MKLQLNTEFDGIYLTDEKNELLSSGTACVMALSHATGEMSAQEKYDRYLLLKKVEGANGEVDLSLEEVARLKKVCGEFPFQVRALGRVWDWLEQK